MLLQINTYTLNNYNNRNTLVKKNVSAYILIRRREVLLKEMEVCISVSTETTISMATDYFQ